VELRLRRFAPIVLLFVLVCIGCFSFAVEYSEATAFLEPHTRTVDNIVQLLAQGKEEDASELLNELHEAVVQARAVLTGLKFAGDANTLTDPFMLPEGVYRVHFTTEGFGAVETIVLSGADRESILFNVFGGNAAEGTSTVYRSKGGRIMIQFSNISAAYKLLFERIE